MSNNKLTKTQNNICTHFVISNISSLSGFVVFQKPIGLLWVILGYCGLLWVVWGYWGLFGLFCDIFGYLTIINMPISAKPIPLARFSEEEGGPPLNYLCFSRLYIPCRFVVCIINLIGVVGGTIKEDGCRVPPTVPPEQIFSIKKSPELSLF